MTLSEAQQEFQVRIYLWATSEWEKELSESFPNLRVFKAGSAWRAYQFLRQLDRTEQIALARSFLKNTFADAARALGEHYSAQEESLFYIYNDFFRIRGLYNLVKRFEKEGQTVKARAGFQVIRLDAARLLGRTDTDDDKSLRLRLDATFGPTPPTFEEQLAAKRAAGETITFASKQELKKAMLSKFKNVYHEQFSKHLINEPESVFRMQYGGWIISTVFFFGRHEGSIDYFHSIASAGTLRYQTKNGGYSLPCALSSNLSLCSWLGISGATEWEYLTDQEVESTCHTAVRLCAQFFEIVPRLLKGLDPESITAE
jgi:hypothetical protein